MKKVLILIISFSFIICSCSSPITTVHPENNAPEDPVTSTNNDENNTSNNINNNNNKFYNDGMQMLNQKDSYILHILG